MSQRFIPKRIATLRGVHASVRGSLKRGLCSGSTCFTQVHSTSPHGKAGPFPPVSLMSGPAAGSCPHIHPGGIRHDTLTHRSVPPERADLPPPCGSPCPTGTRSARPDDGFAQPMPPRACRTRRDSRGDRTSRILRRGHAWLYRPAISPTLRSRPPFRAAPSPTGWSAPDDPWAPASDRARAEADQITRQAEREAETLRKEAALEARERAHELASAAEAAARVRQQEIINLEQSLADKTRALADRLAATDRIEQRSSRP